MSSNPENHLKIIKSENKDDLVNYRERLDDYEK